MGNTFVVFTAIGAVVCLGLMASGAFRAVSILVLAAVAAFSCFGFLASFEPVAGAMYFRVGYALTAVACVAGIWRALTVSSVDPKDGGAG